MAKWLYIVETNCTDATREVEVHEWYNKIHIPDILETPGFIRATRYENIDPAAGKGEFLSIYEIETDDIDTVMKTHRENMDKKRAEGRLGGRPLVQLSRAVYRQISSVSK